jgi:hypothetical protein
MAIRSNTRMVRTRRNKISSLGGALAMSIARKRNDPGYNQLKRLKLMWLAKKHALLRKYGRAGLTAAKKVAVRVNPAVRNVLMARRAALVAQQNRSRAIALKARLLASRKLAQIRLKNALRNKLLQRKRQLMAVKSK